MARTNIIRDGHARRPVARTPVDQLATGRAIRLGAIVGCGVVWACIIYWLM